mmetsp:Transcript_99945/g.158179  ORF Transcript_99945/g.158179 Transcript_99945/m.158179 type:complete len:211 (-) Transcript_99945:79-711(-)
MVDLSALALAAITPVPDLDFDIDLAVITPVPDSLSDAELESNPDEEIDLVDEADEVTTASAKLATIPDHEAALITTAPEQKVRRRSQKVAEFTIADDSDEGSPVRKELSEKASSFVEWLRWRPPFLRFEGKSKGLAWDFPLARHEKRELLLLVMMGAEKELRKGSHEEIRNVISTASSAQSEAGRKLASIAGKARPSFARRSSHCAWAGA